jgi:polyisoprenyl-teichoic acid--peptidoglycan teichoic acid transferase
MTGGKPLQWAKRTLILGLMLAMVAITVPDAEVKPTDFVLVKMEGASSIDSGDRMIWVLAVGSDARPGEDMFRVRGDALQLVGINTRTGAASAIGIPRDSYVPIPGVGSERVNAALYYGGPELLGETVGNLVGIQPDYVFVTRFESFSRLIKYVGPITVDNPVAFSDVSLKPLGFKEGKVVLGPYTALAYSRIRKSLLRGDFDRSANQQRTMRGIQAKVAARAHQPGFIEGGVLSVMQNTKTDVSPSELFRLAHAVAQVNPKRITTCILNGSIGDIGGASVVLPYVEQARSMGDQARNDGTIESCG